MITIIDYGTGNLNSIKNMLKRLGIDSLISNSSTDILKADKLILPGVGAFDYGMSQLHQSGLVEAMNEKVINQKVPILGICLGVQLLTQSSEEGKIPGLGWIKGKTVAFDKTKLIQGQKVPHMGWANITDYQSSKLFAGMSEEPRYYFVHSYHLDIENPAEVLVNVNYGYNFAAGIEKDNILGVQFHPEKSHRFGMQVLKNFAANY